MYIERGKEGGEDGNDEDGVDEDRGRDGIEMRRGWGGRGD